MNTVVNFELAKLLKEKGFNVSTRQRYFIAENIDSDRFPTLQVDCALHNWNEYDDSSTTYYSAPTIAEVVMWLYEKYKIWVSVDMVFDDNQTGFWYCIRQSKEDDDAIQSEEFSSPEEAYEEAFKHTLNKLV